jgi:uncharacterized Rossmann fold enzyme
MTDERFNVFFIYPNGDSTEERRNVTAEEAVKFAHESTLRPAARVGIIREIIITDEDDCTTFHWKCGEGVVFPTPEQREASRKANS